MNRATVLWIRALQGSAKAYRRLALMYGRGDKAERILARLCLEKSMEMGDESGFFLYHKHFSRGKQVIEDGSYQAMCCEYLQTVNPVKRKKLRRYLDLGTGRQKVLFLPDGDLPQTDCNG